MALGVHVVTQVMAIAIRAEEGWPIEAVLADVLEVCGEIDVQPPPRRIGKHFVHLDLRRVTERPFAPSVRPSLGGGLVGRCPFPTRLAQSDTRGTSVES